MTEWDRDRVSDQWPSDPDEHQREQALVIVALACTIKAAARVEQLAVRSPDDLQPLSLTLVQALLSADVVWALVTETSTGPAWPTDQDGADDFNELHKLAEAQDIKAWARLIARAASVITGHLLDSAADVEHLGKVTVGDRRQALVDHQTQLHKAEQERALEALEPLFADDLGTLY